MSERAFRLAFYVLAVVAIAVGVWEVSRAVACQRRGGVPLRNAWNVVACVEAKP